MKRLSIILIIIMSLVIALLVGVLVYSLQMGRPVFAMREPALVNVLTFDANDIKSLDVSYSSDTVRLYPATGNEIVLEEYMSTNDAEMYAAGHQNGGSLSIESGRRPIVSLGIQRINIKLYIPTDWQGDFTYKVSSGGLKTDHNWKFGSFYATSSSGSLRLSEVTTEGDLYMKASSGSLRGGSLTSKTGAVDLHNSSGSIAIDSISAKTKVAISQSSGSLKSDSILCEGDVSLRGSSGSTRVGSISAKRIDSETTSGSQAFEEVVGEIHVIGHSGSIRIGNTKGFGSVKGSSGSVTWTIRELLGDVDVSANSGSARLVLPYDASFKATMRSNSGSIRTDFDDNMMYKNDKKTGVAEIGSAPHHAVSVETSSGSVNVGRE